MTNKHFIIILIAVIIIVFIISISGFCAVDECGICADSAPESLCLIDFKEGRLVELWVYPPYSAYEDVADVCFEYDNMTLIYDCNGIRLVSKPGSHTATARISDERYTYMTELGRHYTGMPGYGDLRKYFCHKCVRKLRSIDVNKCIVLVDAYHTGQPHMYAMIPGDTLTSRHYTVNAKTSDDRLPIELIITSN